MGGVGLRECGVVNIFDFVDSFDFLIFIPLVFSYLACLRLFGFYLKYKTKSAYVCLSVPRTPKR